MRLRDVRLAILTGLAGILHSTAQALLKQAADAQKAAEEPAAAKAHPLQMNTARTGSPPQHWLERVKDARVWYGTGPARNNSPLTSPHSGANNSAPEAATEKLPREPERKIRRLKGPPAAPHAAPKDAQGPSPAPLRSKAGTPDTGEIRSTPRQEKPNEGPPAKTRFRLRPPGRSEAKAGVPLHSPESTGQAYKPTAEESPAQPNPLREAAPEPPSSASVLPREVGLIPNTLRTDGPERYGKPPQAGVGEISDSPQNASLRFQAPRPTIQWTRKAEHEPVPDRERAVKHEVPPAERPAAFWVEHTAGNEPKNIEGIPELHVKASPHGLEGLPARFSPAREPANRAAPWEADRQTQNGGGRWLDLPPDPTTERDLEAERDAWEADLREQRHEQKLAREQRGDLWSA